MFQCFQSFVVADCRIPIDFFLFRTYCNRLAKYFFSYFPLPGEEFAPRSSPASSSAAGSKSSPNVVVVSAVPMSAGSLPPGVSAITSSTGLPAGIQLQV